MNSMHDNRHAGQPPLWLIYLLLAGPIGLLIVFSYIPAASALYHACTEWNPGLPSKWVGLKNFRVLLTDPVFYKSLINVAKLGGFTFIAGMIVPFAVAEMIFHLRSERWRYVCRIALVMPLVVPGVVVFMLWKYIYSDAGILTELLRSLGMHEWIRGWLSHPKTALWCVAFVGFPFANGVSTLILYAGLNNIPETILEAAQLDGLGPLRRIFRIHVPLMAGQVKLLIVLLVIGIVNGFESVYILTLDGGPGYETMVPGLYMYLNGFTFGRMGYACAIGLTMLVFLFIFTLSLNRLMKSADIEQGG
jgi:ABC-type sugar transport system permease subunit